jgi:hypothetical protein
MHVGLRLRPGSEAQHSGHLGAGLLALLVSLAVVACREDPGGVQVDVDLDPSLQGQIEVVSALARSPGETNPVEVILTLRNTGAADRDVTVAGSWWGDGGRRFGGSSGVYRVAAEGTVVVGSGTRSGQVTRFAATVTPGGVTGEARIDEAMLNAGPGVEGYGVAYTPKPTLEQIPVWPVRGLANGEPFHAHTLVFVPEFDQWRLQISDVAFDPLKGIAFARSDRPDLQTIDLVLPYEPTAGAVFEKQLSWGDGIFQIKASADAPGTTSWNSDKAWVIEIDTWQRTQLDVTRRSVVGKASGRLYVSFKGSPDGVQNSFVAGEFKDAPIIYFGESGSH